MYVPLFRESVRLKGREGLFTVLYTDYVRQSADLVAHVTNDKLSRVSFAELFATFEEPVNPSGNESCVFINSALPAKLSRRPMPLKPRGMGPNRPAFVPPAKNFRNNVLCWKSENPLSR
jgi:hypothetical protein